LMASFLGMNVGIRSPSPVPDDDYRRRGRAADQVEIARR
jgi:hypothetical protein